MYFRQAEKYNEERGKSVVGMGTQENREHKETFEWRQNYSRFTDVEKKQSNFHWE